MDMTGKIAVKFRSEPLNALCKKYIPSFDDVRFEIVAVRLFAAKEFIVTVYAADKLSNITSLPDGKQPVKKFKLENVNPADLPAIVEAFNFTLCNENYNLEEMGITNK